MPKDFDRDTPNTPIPAPVGRNHARRIGDLEDRTNELEKGQGKLMGEVGSLGTRVTELELQRPSDRPSQANFSFHPTGARASFKNVSAPVVISAIVAAVLLFILLALIGKLVFT